MCLKIPVIDEASHPRPHPRACHLLAATTLLISFHLPPESKCFHQFTFTWILPQAAKTFPRGFGFKPLLIPQRGESEGALQQTIGSSFWNPQMDFLKSAFSFSGSLDALPIASIFAHRSWHLLISTQVCSGLHLFRAQITVVVALRIKTTGTRQKIIFEIWSGHL